MPVSRRRVAALVAALALAAPGSAAAQSAGDEQYEDPFPVAEEPTRDGGDDSSGGGTDGSSGGGTDGSPGGGTDGSSGGGTTGSPGGTTDSSDTGTAGTADPDAPVSSDDGTTAAATTQAQTAPAGAEELPRTGAEAGLIALGGALLLAGGVALRVRLRERP
jgi:LPXTG-motif cell wall-anchored protein